MRNLTMLLLGRKFGINSSPHLVEEVPLQGSGVDLLRTSKGSLVLEANPCPVLEGIEKYRSRTLQKKSIIR